MGKSLNGKELGQGIVQRKNGLYEGRYFDRYGKRKSVYARTQTEIAKKLRDAIYENEQQITVVDKSITLDEWYEKWLHVCKSHCRDTTKRTYEIQYARL